MTFGIIGLGRFGKLWAEALSRFGNVLVYDKFVAVKSRNKKIIKATAKQAARADILFLLVPISKMEACSREIKKHLLPNTLVVDACSVKVFPAKVMKKLLSEDQPIIATHPLFGPDSIKRSGSFKGHKIVICPLRAGEKSKIQLVTLLKRLGLKVIFSTPENHDRQMATSQSLVHFIGRGLSVLNLRPQIISTPDFASLLSMNDMVVNDTMQLFRDMQTFNPYAAQMRQKFIKSLHKLEKSLAHAK